MFATAWAAMGGDPAMLELVGPRGAVGLASTFAVDELALGAVGVQLLAAAELAAELQPGTARPWRPIELDARHVGFSFRSERFLAIDGHPGGPGFAPLSRFLQTDDGWVRLHANYPWHRAAVEAALGTDPVRAARTMLSQEVEDLVVDAGGVAATVRSAEDWLRHPHGALVAALPLLQLTRVGERSPGGADQRRTSGWPRSPHRTQTLQGLRVLDLTRVLAGPIGTRTLASYGAEVVRVDPPGTPEDRSTLLETGPGKRHVNLDLADRSDRRTVENLLAGADVVVQGYRPGSFARFGLDREALAARRPHLVVVTLSAWGPAGPWARRRGFDSIVQAATGIAHETRDAEGVPGVLPAQALDHGAGHLIAAIVLRALTLAHRDEGTWHGELSLAQLAAWLLAAPRTAGSPRGAPTIAADVDTTPADPAPYLVDLDSPAGRLTIVRPPGSPTWLRGPQIGGPQKIDWTVAGPKVL